MLPTITGWIEQWYGPATSIGMGPLEAPGRRSPVSTDPSFSTTWWVTLSTLCHTIICPAGSMAGFGENDCAPLIATTLTFTTPGAPGGVGLFGFPLLHLG